MRNDKRRLGCLVLALALLLASLAQAEGLFDGLIATATPTPTQEPQPVSADQSASAISETLVQLLGTPQTSAEGDCTVATFRQLTAQQFAAACVMIDFAAVQKVIIDAAQGSLAIYYPAGGAIPAATEAAASPSQSGGLCAYCGGTGFCAHCIGGDCTYCFGEGQTACETCFGGGTCQSCYGTGGEYVYRVGADPKWVKCSRCNGGGSCNRCGGSGYKSCGYCSGTGNCGYCNGTGSCSYCHGTGKQ